ncbi:MAG TPA: phosphoribosyl-ATP diphosphatase [Phototrophicaceae bacterium]|jgi:phosphoribosyl-ATP pyrophosphohydrolase|nr:phosphoribosyl-ATP diphosphatase [Phototrophicaceae bacterium]
MTEGTTSDTSDMLFQLEAIIQDRKAKLPPNSYTTKLFNAGIERITQKVGEEATEVVIASLRQSRQTQVNELADLFYHTLVLMAELGISLQDISAELEERHKPK